MLIDRMPMCAHVELIMISRNDYYQPTPIGVTRYLYRKVGTGLRNLMKILLLHIPAMLF